MRRFGALFLSLALLFVGVDAAASAQKERAADEAAGKWLALVDAGAYRESWQRAASLFKAQVGSSQWQDSVASARAPLGSMISRQLLSAQYLTSLPGAPAGEYVVLQYRSEFEHRKYAIETVTPMLENGRWLVSGYYIR